MTSSTASCLDRSAGRFAHRHRIPDRWVARRVKLDVSALPEQRLPADLEVTAYFIVAEALTNVVKHAERHGPGDRGRDRGPGHHRGADDGRGGADRRGNGLTGLADRVDAMNGTLVLSSPPGLGTRVQVALPRWSVGMSTSTGRVSG